MAKVRSAQVSLAACLVLAALAKPLATSAEAPWPSRPITFVVSYPPGGGADLVARLLAERMGAALGQTIVVENRAGAGGQLGAAAVARSAPDGYTVLVDAGSFAINPSLQPKLPYNPAKDFAAIGVAALFPHVLVVTTSFKANSVADLIDEAKRSHLSFASSGNGSSQHIAAALFMQNAKVSMTHVPYRGGGPAIIDVMGGQVPVLFGNVASTLSHIQAGRLKPLAIAGSKRIPALPKVPTLQEEGVNGAEMYEWNGVFVPARTPAGVVNRLSEAMAKALAEQEVKDRIVALGGEPFQGDREQATKFIGAETQRIAEVIRSNRIKPD